MTDCQKAQLLLTLFEKASSFYGKTTNSLFWVFIEGLFFVPLYSLEKTTVAFLRQMSHRPVMVKVWKLWSFFFSSFTGSLSPIKVSSLNSKLTTVIKKIYWKSWWVLSCIRTLVVWKIRKLSLIKILFNILTHCFRSLQFFSRSRSESKVLEFWRRIWLTSRLCWSLHRSRES